MKEISIYDQTMDEAERLNRNGEYDMAQKLYKSLVVMNPRRYEPYVQLASIAGQRGNYKEALQYLNKAYKLKRSSWQLHLMYGQVYQHMGNFNKAKKHLNISVSIDPRQDAPITLLLEILMGKEDYDSLYNLMNKVISYHPSNSWFLYHYGYVIANSCDPNDTKLQMEAVKALREAHRLGFQEPELIFFLGLAHYNLQEYDRALLYIEEFYGHVKNDQNLLKDDSVLELIMSCHYELGNTMKAKAYAVDLASRGSKQAAELLTIIQTGVNEASGKE